MPSILVVEDDGALQALYEAWLEIAGYSICGQAFDGDSAVALYLAASPKPDIVLMDHRMPGMTGLEAAKAILGLDRAAQIVFVSADSSVREAALEAGALAFLAKPFALGELQAILERVLLGGLVANAAGNAAAASGH